MRRVWFLPFFFFSLSLSAISPSIVARVNGEPIYTEELTQKSLDQMIDYKLAIQQAHETGMDLLPELKNATDDDLHRAFMAKDSNRKALKSVREKSKIAILTEKQ